MLAGKTNLEVGTKVRVTKIASSDPEDQVLVGITGAITHPFPGAMIGNKDSYIAGLWVDKEHAAKVSATPLGNTIANLVRGNEFEVIPDEESE